MTQGPTKPKISNKMSKEDAAWLAGILEGEGCFMLASNGTKTRIPRVSINSTDKDIIERVANMFKSSIIYATKPEGYKPQWRTDLARKHDLINILKQILPYMGVRRSAKIEMLLEYYGVGG